MGGKHDIVLFNHKKHPKVVLILTRPGLTHSQFLWSEILQCLVDASGASRNVCFFLSVPDWNGTPSTTQHTTNKQISQTKKHALPCYKPKKSKQNSCCRLVTCKSISKNPRWRRYITKHEYQPQMLQSHPLVAWSHWCSRSWWRCGALERPAGGGAVGATKKYLGKF